MVSCVKAMLNTDVVKPKLAWFAGGQNAERLLDVVKLIWATLDEPDTRHVESLKNRLVLLQGKVNNALAGADVVADNKKFHEFYDMAKMGSLKTLRS
eukprot:4694685-Pyramimonas_sp.AAC.1